ncbi:hypothetical protein [Flammeovirga sp. SJP92]|uniref:hypothetical protein n=1 Tax=Flammeovirga sp. SJP92 TaxID=1775430 RepID=UPI000788AFAE|nr:hypothetical protein [Flammeovirga sp. SJP92]KXX71953.1 hypothetical protein AVL50_03985 [Flammeovirga sp. SJP92]
MKKTITYASISIILLLLLYYLFLPTVRFDFTGWIIAILAVAGAILSIESIVEQSRKITPVKTVTLSILILGLLYVTVVPFTTSWALLRSKDYRDLIGEVKAGENFTDHVAPISTDEIRIVDNAMAHRLGDKVLGSIPSLGSQAELGEFSIQKVNGKLYWVAPLLHSGIFKWNNNREGTPGYVMVSATNERDVELVQTVGGKGVQIKYQPGAYFSTDLHRHIYFNGYMTKGFTDFSFEIDDDGKPYWIVTLYDKKVGFSGRNATGVLTVDVTTGEIKEYEIDKAPIWIDRIQPEDFIVKQLDDWGEYVLGYFNFSNERKLTTTKGISLVYGANNRAYWYTGLTSVGSDEGTVGFVLVDTRTKETIWYRQIGATEQAARQSAMGKVQEKGYVASFPITYNINGMPTYVMSLKDRAGLIKMIAMVSVEDYTIVGVGNTIKEALRSYKNSLNSKGNSVSPSTYANTFEITSVVTRISKDIRNGNTNYYLMVRDKQEKLFIGSSMISSELPITAVGDSITVRYDDSNSEIVDIVDFENLTIDLK